MMKEHRNSNTQYSYPEISKRIIVLMIFIVLASMVSTSLASSSSMPATNTDSAINFSGFEWYSDYPTVIKTAKEKGIVNNSSCAVES